MNIQIAALSDFEQAQDIDRLLRQERRPRQAETPALDGKAFYIAPAKADGGKAQEWLALVCCLDRRTEDARQIAYAFGHQKIMLHQPFDAPRAGMIGIADAPRELGLEVERQPLLCPVGQIV